MNINPTWNFRQISRKLRTLKHEYNRVLASFSIVREENAFILATRNAIYSMNLDEFQKDRVWEYINGDIYPDDTFILFGFFEDEEED